MADGGGDMTPNPVADAESPPTEEDAGGADAGGGGGGEEGGDDAALRARIAWFERVGITPERPLAFTGLVMVYLASSALVLAIAGSAVDPTLSALGRWRPLLPWIIFFCGAFVYDFTTMYFIILRADGLVTWWSCTDRQRPQVVAAVRQRQVARWQEDVPVWTQCPCRARRTAGSA